MPSPGSRGYFKLHPRTNLTELMRLMQNPTCWNIVRRLIRRPENVGTLTRGLDVQQSTVSHSLAMLLAADLVEFDQAKKYHVYRLAGLVSLKPHGAEVIIRIPCLNGQVLALETSVAEGGLRMSPDPLHRSASADLVDPP